jgi:hypothetical protein
MAQNVISRTWLDQRNQHNRCIYCAFSIPGAVRQLKSGWHLRGDDAIWSHAATHLSPAELT